MRIKLSFVTLLLVVVCQLNAQTALVNSKSNLTIKTDVASIQEPLDKVFITYYNTSTKVRFTDSADLRDTKNVVFKLNIDEPILAQLRVVPAKPTDTTKKARPNSARNYLSVYLEPGTLSIIAKDSFSNSTITGSKAHEVYTALKANVAKFDPVLKDLYAKYAEARRIKMMLRVI